MNAKGFFDSYVFGFMCEDIRRELEWARQGKPAGNFLCALGLFAYTEFMGSLLIRPDQNLRERKKSGKAEFDAFFAYMGVPYGEFLKSCNVYDVFRCGLAHEYFVKKECTIYMLNTPGEMTVKGNEDRHPAPSMLVLDAKVMRPVDVAIGRAPNDRVYFVVQKYYEDFRGSCERLLAKLEEEVGHSSGFEFSWLWSSRLP